MVGWETKVEGNVAHIHDPEYTTLTVDPPIAQVRCRGCGRTLWQRQKPVRPAWPIGDDRGYPQRAY